MEQLQEMISDVSVLCTVVQVFVVRRLRKAGTFEEKSRQTEEPIEMQNP
jgi:hypothetical protein